MSISSNSDEEMPNTPPEIEEAVNVILSNLLPEKSRNKYELTYKLFMKWKT